MEKERKTNGIEAVDRDDVRKGSTEVDKTTRQLQRLTRLTTGEEILREILPTIRFNQLRAIPKLVEFIKAGKTKGYYRMPTGAGKTLLFGLISMILDESTLILVPNTTQLENTRSELISLGMKPDMIGLVGGGKNEIGRRNTIMTYQSFINRGAPEGTSLIICDEVHRSLGEVTRGRLDETMGGEMDDEGGLVAEDYRAEEEALDLVSKIEGEVLALGFTATSQLGSKTVDDIHGELIDSTSYGELTTAGFLKKVVVHSVKGEIDEETERAYMTLEKEEKNLRKNDTADKILSAFIAFKNEFKDHPLRPIAFCSSMTMATYVCERAEALGLRTELVVGGIGDHEKAEQRMLAGEIDLIVSINKLLEGWNFPALNTVLWIRGSSSPAPIIQGMGRAMRAYLNELFAHLFESSWTVSSPQRGDGEGKNEVQRLKTAKGSTLLPSRKALSFAQAVLALGEDLDGVVADSAEVDYVEYCSINPLGIYEHPKHGTVCGIESYTRTRGIGSTTFREWGGDKLVPVPGIIGVSGKRNDVPLYRRKEVDAIINEKRTNRRVALDDNGVYTLDGEVEVVGLNAYSHSLGITPDTLKGWIAEANIPVVEGVEGSRGIKHGPVHLKVLVDEVIKGKTGGKRTITLDPATQTYDLPGIGEVSIVSRYALPLGTTHASLGKWLVEAGIEAIAGFNVQAGPDFVDLYRTSDMTRVAQEKKGATQVSLNPQGVGFVPNVGIVIGSAYANNPEVGLEPKTLKAWLEKAGVLPVPNVKGSTGKKPGNVWLKSEADRVIAMKKAEKTSTRIVD